MEPQDVPDTNATVLYVGNLDKRVTDQMMLNILRTGLQHIKDKIMSANMFHGDMSSPEGYCFVQFEDNNAACQAMTFLNGRDFCGKKVKVNWATNSTTGGPPKVIGTSVSMYVGNLDDNIDENELKRAFEVFGEILNVKVVRDPVTNRSKNIGFISFTNKPDAEKAIRDMNGAMLKTKPIKTNWATRNSNQKKEELDYDEVYKETDSSNCTVYVGGISANCPDSQIRRHFEDYGTIQDIRIFPAKNYAFIRFESHAAAATAICKTNGTDLLGSTLKCWWGKEGPDSGSGGGQSHSNNYNNSSRNFNDSKSMQNMTPQQQQQQYMQYMQNCNPYYQQQYYQYWMQQYQYQQMMAQQQNGGGGYQQQQQNGGNYQGYQQGYAQQQQQQSGGGDDQQYPPQSYQS